MSITKIHLRKLLRTFYAPDNLRISILRGDIRGELKKESGEDGEGGDFHGPFWTDAKRHAAGTGHLPELTKIRIDANKARARLYPKLEKGFLSWWNEKRRWKNQPVELIEHVKGKFDIPELAATVKVENLLAVKVGDDFEKAIYPYFAEVPILPDEGARIGLWLIGEVLIDYDKSDLRVLDILRGAFFGIADCKLKGNERALFMDRYRAIISEWKKLRKEYE